jgi:hypothetical protein
VATNHPVRELVVLTHPVTATGRPGGGAESPRHLVAVDAGGPTSISTISGRSPERRGRAAAGPQSRRRLPGKPSLTRVAGRPGPSRGPRCRTGPRSRRSRHVFVYGAIAARARADPGPTTGHDDAGPHVGHGDTHVRIPAHARRRARARACTSAAALVARIACVLQASRCATPGARPVTPTSRWSRACSPCEASEPAIGSFACARPRLAQPRTGRAPCTTTMTIPGISAPVASARLGAR